MVKLALGLWGAAWACAVAVGCASGAPPVRAGAEPSGGPSDYQACQQDGDCTVVSNGCCDACEPMEASQLRAVAKVSQSSELAARCPIIPPCAPCRPSSESEATSQFFSAVCVEGRCGVRDSRAARP